MFPTAIPTINQITSNDENLNDFRQSSDNSHFNDFNGRNENGNFKYTTLINRSPSNISTTTTDESEEAIGQNKKMVKSSSDQKIPQNIDKTNSNSYYYVNKNGFPVQVTSPKSFAQDLNKDKISFEKTPLICTDLLLEVYKTNKENLTSDSNKLNNERANINQDRQSVGRSVPSHGNQSLSSLNLSSTSSLVQRDANGNVIINTNLAIQEPNVEINSDHVKYINIFSILCCWCFPITGLLTIFFARLTKKYYEMRDLNKAKKFLNRAEWSLMLTFFFGCTLIALFFALMEAFWLKTGANSSSKHASIFHTRSLPK